MGQEFAQPDVIQSFEPMSPNPLTSLRTARNIPKRHSPTPNASHMSKMVGTSRSDLIRPGMPNFTRPAGRATPCQIESGQEGSVSFDQSAVVTGPSVRPVASSSSENSSILANFGCDH
ncbi:hypothetical protein O77CONTIG1_03738 [Leptolyngbya sp. O-77]|nr:hypothetical protein O77CONTIG1_03738 [Leptolyngbya sp. O-77]